MGYFCTNCGTELRKEDNFCFNCGVKIDKSHMKQKPLFDSVTENMEKKKEKREPVKEDRSSAKIQKNETKDGGYCNLSCIHCHEEYFSSSGEIEGDFCSDGIVEYYCSLGHSVALGTFCKYYE